MTDAPHEAKKAYHPTSELVVTFDPEKHSYTDQDGTSYLSGTTFVKKQFPPFDAHAAARRVAERENRLEMEVLAEWDQKRAESAAFGNRCHHYAEASLKGTQRPEVAAERDRPSFLAIDHALPLLRQSYSLWEPESIVFDPVYRIAGTIDLSGLNLSTGALTILDWKTSGTIDHFAKYNGRGLGPIAHLHDCNLMHYAMQLSLYAWIMLDSGYVNPDTPVELAVIHLPPLTDKPVWLPVPYLAKEIEVCVELYQETRQ